MCDPRRAPGQTGEQDLGADAQRPAEAYERVGPRNPFAALELADRRAMKAGEEAEVFLGDAEPLAAATEVFAEDHGEALVARPEAHGRRLRGRLRRSGSARGNGAPLASG